MNKRGSVVDILIFVVISFVIVMFFGLWIYGFNLVTENLISIPGTDLVNISQQAVDTFGQVNSAQTTWVHILAFAMMFSMVLSIIVTNFFVKAHPTFLIIYIFVIIGGIMASVELSNFYETLLQDATLGSTFQAFTGANFIVLNLPVWVTVVGFLGAIFLFAGIVIDRGQGGGIS